MRKTTIRTALLVLLGLGMQAGVARGQSLFSTRGLGLPLPAVDARSQLLGGFGVGVIGMNPSLVNPADMAGLRRRGVSAALLASDRSQAFEGDEASVGTTRFPLVQAMVPLGDRLVVSLGYGSFLDQTWGVATERRAVLAGDTLDIEDEVESDGGLSQARLGLAFTVTDAVAVGVAGGLYTGRQDVIFTRRFGESAPAGFQDFNTRVAWGYNAPLLSFGVRWDPQSFLRVSGVVTWSGELDADADEGDVSDQSFDLPLEVVGGASAILSPGLLAAVNVKWAGWSGTSDDFAAIGVDTEARDVWSLGAGIEYDGAEERSTEFPVRLGFNVSQLPFTFQGEAPTEWSVGAGLGLRVGADRANPSATLDLSVSRGERGDLDTTRLSESFWKFGVSLTLFGR